MSGDRDDPLKCVEMVFGTCKALQESALHYKNEAMRLRASIRHAEDQASHMACILLLICILLY